MTKRRVLGAFLTLCVLSLIGGYATAAGAQQTTPVNCIASEKPDSTCNVVGGWAANQVARNVSGATIAGGGERDLPNRVIADYGTVGGGHGNLAGDRATVAGGSNNTANGFRASIGGGNNNAAGGAYTTIAGGENNIASYFYSTIGGGGTNESSGRYTTVGGGSGNVASFTLATVAGGSNNTASSINSTVAGGDNNIATGAYSTVSGGSNNHASGFNTAVAGGSGNFATGDSATAGGGLSNRAYADYGTVAGGNGNVAGSADGETKTAHYSTISGGSRNTAMGAFSTIPGGAGNSAAGDYGFAAGRRALINAAHAGTFLFADSNDSDFVSSAANEFAARATGGVRFVTAIDSVGNPTAGVRLSKGSGSWESLSDRNAKENIVPVDPRAVVAQLAAIPITTWSYKTQDPSIRHIGPMAQDFYALGIGEDDKYIGMIDESGVALAAIQGVYGLNQDQARQITALQSENTALKSQIDELDARVSALEQLHNSGDTASTPTNLSSILALGAVCLGAFTLARGRQ